MQARLAPVIESGQRVFGENRVQEAKGKWPALMQAYPGLKLHLIGPLQSNKAKEAVALFDAIHSVDRPSICQALAKEIESQDKRPELFVQINTGEEPQKAGVAPADADAFIAACRETYGLVISGLMCIPPVDEPPAPHFALTAKIAARNGVEAFVDGHERRLRGRDRDGRHACAGGLGDFRASRVVCRPGQASLSSASPGPIPREFSVKRSVVSTCLRADETCGYGFRRSSLRDAPEMTTMRLPKPHRHFPEHAKIRLHPIARGNRQRRMAGAGRDHLAGAQA